MNFTDLRLKKGLSIQEVSTQLKLSPATIYRYEKDGRIPTKTILKKIVNLYNCTPSELGEAILKNLEVEENEKRNNGNYKKLY